MYEGDNNEIKIQTMGADMRRVLSWNFCRATASAYVFSGN